MSFRPDTRCSCTVRQAQNFGDRASHLSVDILLLHYTGMESGDAAIDWLCARESGVSCHYVVREDGAILQLVPEDKRAWHAGKSCWQGEADTNSRSIGIEIVNPGHENGYPDFPHPQIEAVTQLSRDILARWRIAPRNVLAHSDVAPGRKSDPGEKFPWRLLHEAGVGLWVPEAERKGVTLRVGHMGEEVLNLQRKLQMAGYCLAVTGNFDQATRNCVTAFQLHYRQSCVDGAADGGTVATLDRLIKAARK